MMPSTQNAFVVGSGSFFIGTQPQCHLRLSCPGVDELHCAVVGRQGRFFLRNFARTAGVRLNGRCVFGEMELRDQDGIDVGAARLSFGHDGADQQAQVRLLSPQLLLEKVAAPLPLTPRRTRVTQIIHQSALVQPPSALPPQVRKTRVTQLGLAAPPPLEPEPITAVPSGSPVRKTRVTQILRKSDLAALETPAETPAPAPAVPEIRKTRVTQVLRKSDLASLETPAAALATAPAIPEVRKTRVTQILRKADIASQEAESLLAPPAPAPVETPNEEEAAALLLTESEAEAAPADSSTAEPAANAETPLAGIKGVPAYALAMGGKPGEEKRPMLRLIVGRKDRVQPLLRKWELEGAQIAAQHRPSRVPSLVMSSRWLVAGMAVLLVLGLAGGYFIGRPRYWRAANANPIAITIDQWDRLSDAEQNDPDNISAVSNHIRAGAAADRPPAEPKEPGPAKSAGSADPNI